MCSVSRNLLRFNVILGGHTLSQRREIARRVVHLDKKLYSNDNRNDAKEAAKLAPLSDTEQRNILPPKFKVFRDEDAPVIFDVEEERERIDLAKIHVPQEEVDIFEGVNLERGVNGVYDLQDLVDLLRRNNVMDVCVVTVPADIAYVDSIAIVTGRSPKHMNATAEIVRRVFKKKRLSGDRLPKIEGEKSKDWIALDLGNIALHIFSSQARKIYDLEMLWSVGSRYDDQSNVSEDKLSELLARHSYLAGFQPAEAAN